MAEERKKYDKEFKFTVVELSLLRGKVKEVAEEYGIDPQMLSSWRSQYKNHKEIAFPGNGKKMQTEAEKEISRLQKELADARMERDILKKAISIFSSSDRKNMRS
ncbi:MAG: transposase [Bacteroidetes bacterium]|jgi:transposase|nr:transposase [Bacteroidota bacterium]